jgi:hypothetical protein
LTSFSDFFIISPYLTNLRHNDVSEGSVVVGKKLNHRISISLDEDTFNSVTRMAVESHSSIGWVVRYAVDYLLKAGQEGKSPQLILPFSDKEKSQLKERE